MNQIRLHQLYGKTITKTHETSDGAIVLIAGDEFCYLQARVDYDCAFIEDDKLSVSSLHTLEHADIGIVTMNDVENYHRSINTALQLNRERAERAEYDRLKAKFEQPAQ